MILFLDLRSAKEAKKKPVLNAVNLDVPKPPLNANDIYDLTEKLQAVTDKYPGVWAYILFCAKGIRSKLGAAILEQAGYKVFDFGGLKSIKKGKYGQQLSFTRGQDCG